MLWVWQRQRIFFTPDHIFEKPGAFGRTNFCQFGWPREEGWNRNRWVFFGGGKTKEMRDPKVVKRIFFFIGIGRLELFCMMKHLIDLWSISRIGTVQDGVCQSLKTTSRCDMDTVDVDVDVNDLIFSTSIHGKMTGFFCGPKTGFSPNKGPVKRFVSPWEEELLGCEKFRSG